MILLLLFIKEKESISEEIIFKFNESYKNLIVLEIIKK
jgi:hypothetical protein